MHAADEEEELRGQDDPGERDAERGADGVGAEAFIGEPDILRCDDLAEQDAAAKDDQHGGEDDGERTVAALLVAASR